MRKNGKNWMASVEMSRLQNGAVFWEKQLLVMFGV